MGEGAFWSRHLGSGEEVRRAMAREVGYDSVEALMEAAVPEGIRRRSAMELPEPLDEEGALGRMREMMGRNQVRRSLIGMGYADCVTPPVLQRNILENPGWYTAYTPYQAEISQGRLEACLNFQTMVCELTALDVANASLLDEGTAAAEAMSLAMGSKAGARRFLVSDRCHPQTIAVVRTRAEPLGIEVEVGDWRGFVLGKEVGGVLVQYPDTEGRVEDFGGLVERAHEVEAQVVVATDLLALSLLKPPGEFGADIAVGNSQRFGVALGFGGPHAAFLACRDGLKRRIPGRLVGVSVDAAGRVAYRLSLQTREQHIRRDKATSNICTAQVLLAVMASMYAVYHGPEGLRRIAMRVRGFASRLAGALGVECGFDTMKVGWEGERRAEVLGRVERAGNNLRVYEDGGLGLTLDERTTEEEVRELAEIFGVELAGEGEGSGEDGEVAAPFRRETGYLRHPVFHRYHTETEMMRYLHRLEAKDLALNTSMIPLGSCTMKLNAAAEMMPLSWPEVNRIHPFAGEEQTAGYAELTRDLERWLAECTGFDAVSLQPNAGSQGEYAGLLAIRGYHRSRGEEERNVCLIPVSAHGTNPASAVMAGMRVVPVACDGEGNIDVADLRGKAEKHGGELAALMITYPSTHGVFEESVVEICRIVHEQGGQVYLDGANFNAQVGLCAPGELGADVCHLNLHKTFCIPHGGGGPGVGPIAVAGHLAPYLPGHPYRLERKEGPVSAAPYGSASILTISWMYIAMMGAEGLREATKLAILNANYLAARLKRYYPLLYTGKTGLVAHECILDLRPFKERAGVEVEDVAKRLMDYGFHAPTMSWPVPGTLMVEPTESESRGELDRFCEAMIAVHGEIEAIASGVWPREDNPLKNAPHTAEMVTAEEWTHPYTREVGAFPAAWLREHKYWPAVRRIDNVYGDRNLVCTCPGVEDFEGVEQSGREGGAGGEIGLGGGL